MLVVDPAVVEAAEEALQYYARDAPELAERLRRGIAAALRLIELVPERGRRIPGLPVHYRRMRLAAPLPGYFFFYRIDPTYVLVFLLRHERQRPYAPHDNSSQSRRSRTTRQPR